PRSGSGRATRGSATTVAASSGWPPPPSDHRPDEMTRLGQMFRTATFVALLVFTTACGPSDEPGLDPEETITAFCEALFACPDARAMETYGSREGCEDVHRMDYEDRDPICQEAVL